jgi:hypothetical protein
MRGNDMCQNCHFFEVGNKVANKPDTCHLNPPTPILLQTHADITMVGQWAIVLPTEWYGHWKPLSLPVLPS